MNQVAVVDTPEVKKERTMEYKIRNGNSISLQVSPEICKRFGGFSVGQRIKRKSVALPKPEESWDLWEKARILYKATIRGVANNPTAIREFWGQECLWIQVDGEDFVTSFPSNVVSAEDFANIGVVPI